MIFYHRFISHRWRLLSNLNLRCNQISWWALIFWDNNFKILFILLSYIFHILSFRLFALISVCFMNPDLIKLVSLFHPTEMTLFDLRFLLFIIWSVFVLKLFAFQACQNWRIIIRTVFNLKSFYRFRHHFALFLFVVFDFFLF